MKPTNYDDLLVQSRFRNAILWNIMGGKTAAACALECGVNKTEFGELLNLKTSPFRHFKGEHGWQDRNDFGTLIYRKTPLKIAAYYKVLPEEIFPESLYSLSLPASVERFYSSIEILPLLAASNIADSSQSPENVLILSEAKETLEKILSTLPLRQRLILKMRFGFEDGSEHTLEEVGQSFQVGSERIRQIEAKALRNLRHPSISRKLKPLWEQLTA